MTHLTSERNAHTSAKSCTSGHGCRNYKQLDIPTPQKLCEAEQFVSIMERAGETRTLKCTIHAGGNQKIDRSWRQGRKEDRHESDKGMESGKTRRGASLAASKQGAAYQARASIAVVLPCSFYIGI